MLPPELAADAIVRGEILRRGAHKQHGNHMQTGNNSTSISIAFLSLSFSSILS